MALPLFKVWTCTKDEAFFVSVAFGVSKKMKKKEKKKKASSLFLLGPPQTSYMATPSPDYAHVLKRPLMHNLVRYVCRTQILVWWFAKSYAWKTINLFLLSFLLLMWCMKMYDDHAIGLSQIDALSAFRSESDRVAFWPFFTSKRPEKRKAASSYEAKGLF